MCVAPGPPSTDTRNSSGPRPGLGAARTHSLAPIFPHGHGQPQWVLRRRHVMSTHMLKALWNQEKKMWRERCIDILVAECPSCALSSVKKTGTDHVSHHALRDPKKTLCDAGMKVNACWFLCTFYVLFLHFFYILSSDWFINLKICFSIKDELREKVWYEKKVRISFTSISALAFKGWTDDLKMLSKDRIIGNYFIFMALIFC